MYIVLTQNQRDSLVNILMPLFNKYTDSLHIELEPIRLQDSTKYILQQELMLKPEWKPLYDAFTKAGYIRKLTIRAVADSEFYKPPFPF